MLDRVTTRAPVREDAVAAEPEQRRATVRLVVKLPPQAPQRGSEHRGSKLGHQAAAEQRVAHYASQVRDHSFARLEHDVADEPVRDDNVGNIMKEVAAFDVADEPHGHRFEQTSGLEHELIAL